MTTILRIKGPLDENSTPYWWKTIIDKLANSEGNAVLDFSLVTFVDILGMDLLFSLHKCFTLMGRQLTYGNLHDQPFKAFTVLNFDKSASQTCDHA